MKAVYLSVAILLCNSCAAQAKYANGCPEGFPLDCGNSRCCPSGNNLWCGGDKMKSQECIDKSDELTSKQLKTLIEKCHPLLVCHPSGSGEPS